MAEITALMTSYNGEHYIKETIESVLNQSFKDFVFLIIDDGSTDNTVEIIKSYQDPRIQLIESKANKGVGYQLREAVKLIKTPYIVKIDSDDISHPDRFALQYQYMQDHPNLDIIKCYFSYFADNNEVEDSERYKQYKAVKEIEHNSINTTELIHEHLPRWMCVIHSTLFYRASIFKITNYPKIRMGEDYYLLYKARTNHAIFGCIQESLVRVRLHTNSATTNKKAPKYFANLLLDMKKEALDAIAHKSELWIYGVGELGKEAALWLIKNNYNFVGFLDRTTKSSVRVLNKDYPVNGINEYKKGKVLIAAQPVRFEIMEILKQKGMKEWQDFMVVG